MHLGVVDYGASNIHSVARALQSLGSKVSIVDTPDKFKSIDKLVFPGQGSMGSCIKKLNETEMINPLLDTIKSKPFLGICLGLQILFNSSEESKEKGLGVINGSITKIKDINKENLKIPHMGWNNVKIEKKHELFSEIEDKQFFYFVHSFVASNTETSITTTHYGEEFVSSLATENIFATQFHPEKSGEIGLKFLENFINWKI
ncbi:MAG: imidazole glycerol phosphate synthase subunit HisH [Gammaproteobacteria bacterium]